ncbi:MAG: hypothetical protein ABI778_04425 [Ignavibacteriota bacterium]
MDETSKNWPKVLVTYRSKKTGKTRTVTGVEKDVIVVDFSWDEPGEWDIINVVREGELPNFIEVFDKLYTSEQAENNNSRT